MAGQAIVVNVDDDVMVPISKCSLPVTTGDVISAVQFVFGEIGSTEDHDDDHLSLKHHITQILSSDGGSCSDQDQDEEYIFGKGEAICFEAHLYDENSKDSIENLRTATAIVMPQNKGRIPRGRPPGSKNKNTLTPAPSPQGNLHKRRKVGRPRVNPISAKSIIEDFNKKPKENNFNLIYYNACWSYLSSLPSHECSMLSSSTIANEYKCRANLNENRWESSYVGSRVIGKTEHPNEVIHLGAYDREHDALKRSVCAALLCDFFEKLRPTSESSSANNNHDVVHTNSVVHGAQDSSAQNKNTVFNYREKNNSSRSYNNKTNESRSLKKRKKKPAHVKYSEHADDTVALIPCQNLDNDAPLQAPMAEYSSFTVNALKDNNANFSQGQVMLEKFAEKRGVGRPRKNKERKVIDVQNSSIAAAPRMKDSQENIPGWRKGQRRVSAEFNYGPWSAEEKGLLFSAVREYGLNDVNAIQSIVKTRNFNQINLYVRRETVKNALRESDSSQSVSQDSESDDEETDFRASPVKLNCDEWSVKESLEMLSIIKMHGAKNLSYLESTLKARSSEEIKAFLQQYSLQDIERDIGKHTHWTQNEHKLLVAAIQINGMHNSKSLHSLLKERSELAIKQYIHRHGLRKYCRISNSDSDTDEDRSLQDTTADRVQTNEFEETNARVNTNAKWTHKEHKSLFEAVQKYGSTDIISFQKVLKARSESQIKEYIYRKKMKKLSNTVGNSTSANAVEKSGDTTPANVEGNHCAAIAKLRRGDSKIIDVDSHVGNHYGRRKKNDCVQHMKKSVADRLSSCEASNVTTVGTANKMNRVDKTSESKFTPTENEILETRANKNRSIVLPTDDGTTVATSINNNSLILKSRNDAIKEYENDFRAALVQHQLDTKALLKEAADLDLVMVPVEKITEARLRNVKFLQIANRKLRQLGAARCEANRDVIECLSMAEDVTFSIP